jgi:hypothetical protein
MDVRNMPVNFFLDSDKGLAGNSNSKWLHSTHRYKTIPMHMYAAPLSYLHHTWSKYMVHAHSWSMLGCLGLLAIGASQWLLAAKTPLLGPSRHTVHHTQSMMPSKFEVVQHHNGPKGFLSMHQNHWFQHDVAT